MDFKVFLAGIIAGLTAFASRTTSNLDDMALSLLIAVRDSPQLLEWLEKIVNALKGNAEGVIDPNDPELLAAIDASPAYKTWELRRRKREGGGGATDPSKEQLGIAGIAGLLKYLPMLIAVYRAWKEATSQPTS